MSWLLPRTMWMGACRCPGLVALLLGWSVSWHPAVGKLRTARVDGAMSPRTELEQARALKIEGLYAAQRNTAPGASDRPEGRTQRTRKTDWQELSSELARSKAERNRLKTGGWTWIGHCSGAAPAGPQRSRLNEEQACLWRKSSISKAAVRAPGGPRSTSRLVARPPHRGAAAVAGMAPDRNATQTSTS